MDQKDWIMLKTLYEEGSITKASEKLYVSQPALTKRIQQIEHEFEVKIISRSRKGIKFTSEGEYLVRYASEMLTLLQKTRDTLLNMKSNTVQGTLRIGVSKNFAYHDLPAISKQFSKLFPKVKMHITSGYSSDIFKFFQSEKLHIAIIRGDFYWNGPKKKIIEENICIISKQKISVDLLQEQPRIIYKTDPLLEQQLENWWNERFSNPPLTVIEVDNSQTCVGMVQQGLGYAILPEYCFKNQKDLYIEDIYNNGELVMRDTWMIYNEKDMELSSVREFVTFVEKHVIKS